MKNRLIEYIFKYRSAYLRFDISDVPELYQLIVDAVIKQYKEERYGYATKKVYDFKMEHRIGFGHHPVTGEFILQASIFGTMDCNQCEFWDKESRCKRCNKFVKFIFVIKLNSLDTNMGIVYPCEENGWTKQQLNNITKMPKIPLEIN
jgi:hypothetical protein